MSTNYMARTEFLCRKKGLCLEKPGHLAALPQIIELLCDEVQNRVQVDPALKEKLKQNTVTLESEYEKLEKSDLDNWENIRGPRLWEDSRTVQKQRREAVRLKTE
ncbi:cytochrome c oxidase assembly protein COX16 homolog, mitochondrial isoform X2 [Harpia harpyja]|uniref:cytochrome c oxidase assembly protein COX16 homolog, mitochondrial isoform X2 n=1 Tax=Harpia harpyja TaxID=202280 RepID=UPI0022B20ABB|nr:cytochrome c oxidase assembly protein COX16 homolog, mitochondrial isoform X2 [Harpia harpyja]